MAQSISNPQAAPPVVHAMDIVAPFSARSLFWRPRYLKPAPILHHLPFLFWLTEMSRPGCVAHLGPGQGVGYFALCQAVDKLNLDTRCHAAFAQEAQPAAAEGHAAIAVHNEEFYSDFSQLEERSLGHLRRRLGPEAVDLLVVEAPLEPAAMAEFEEDWLPVMAPGGALVLHGLDSWLAEAEGAALIDALQRRWPSVRLEGGEGLLLLLCGEEAPERLKRLVALKPGQPGYGDVHRVFQRLGRALHFEAECQLAKERVQQSQAAREETLQALRAVEGQRAQISLELEELGAELAQRTGERDQAEADRQAVGRHLNALEDRHKVVAGKLEAALAEAEEKRDWLRGKLADSETTLVKERAAVEELQKALSDADEKRAALKTKLSEKQELIEAKDKRVSVLETWIEDHKAKLADTQTQLETEWRVGEALLEECDVARGEMALLTEALAAAETRAADTLRIMTERCEALAAQNEETRRELGEERWQSGQRFEELALLTRMLEESRGELQALRGSTSWKMTGPVRRLRRISSGGGKHEEGSAS